MKSSNILSLKNLSVTIGNSSILKNISFNLKKNEILGVVGESGSGKSITAFSIINLFNTNKIIKKGKVVFNNKRIDSVNRAELEKIRGTEISIIFQEPMSSLNPSMKCGRQVFEVLQTHNISNNKENVVRVLDLFKKVKLKNPKSVYNKYPHELSGGQQQRIMIAIAIACNPKILIADEPTTSLDGIVKEKIISLLRKIQKETKMSIIFVSHDLDLVSKFAKNIIVLNKGEIVEFGKSKKIFKYPENNYTKMLLESRPPRKGRPIRLPTIENNLEKFTLVSQKKRSKKHQKIYNQNPILTVDELCFSHNKKLVLNDVNFKIYAGETLGLIGESGSGKSTIAKCILNLHDYKYGDITYQNIDIKKYDKKKFRRNIQLVFQDPFSSLNPEMSIGNSIIEPMIAHEIYKNDEERILKACQLLEDVGLDKNDFSKYPSQFSGGQRQRIGIARALALNPKLIILDEPVSALDVSIRAQIMNLLVDLQNQHDLAYVLIAHNLATVRYMCHKTAVMYLGVIQEMGDTEAVFTNPQHIYTNALMSAALPSHPDIDREEIVLPGEVVSPINPPSGDVFQTRTPLKVDKSHNYANNRPPLVQVGKKDHWVVETPWSIATKDMKVNLEGK